MNDLRTAAQQALEALERYRQMMFAEAGCRWGDGDAAITALRAALAQQDEAAQQTRKDGRYSVAYRCKCGHEQNVTEIMHGGRTYAGSGANWCDGCGDGPPVRVDAMQQQAEPAQDRHRACPTHCCPVHGCKYMHDDCPVVSGAVQPVYPRNNGCESCADEAEPLNLSDRAVQRRLAAQWGYVHEAQQAEPETCTWHQDGDSDSGVYATSCRHYFNLEDGTPEDNKMQWCCYCGKRLVRELITEGDDE